MSALLRTISTRVTPVLRGPNVTQKANLVTRPAKDELGPVETTIGLAMFSMAILAPPAWILAHLEEYKKKD